MLCSQRTAPEEKASVGPWLLALFIFVVCGSGERPRAGGRVRRRPRAPVAARAWHCPSGPLSSLLALPGERSPLRSLAAIFQIIQSIRMGM